MKKFIVASFMALGIFGATAQQKMAHINTEALMDAMPEIVKASAELEGYKTDLGNTYVELNKEYAAKDSIFVKDSLTFSPTMKTIKLKELVTLYQRLNNWQQEAQEMYSQEAEKKMGPLRDKALVAIRAVAKENGYGYVMEQGNLLVYPASDDILPLVKKKLNIVDKPGSTK